MSNSKIPGRTRVAGVVVRGLQSIRSDRSHLVAGLLQILVLVHVSVEVHLTKGMWEALVLPLGLLILMCLLSIRKQLGRPRFYGFCRRTDRPSRIQRISPISNALVSSVSELKHQAA